MKPLCYCGHPLRSHEPAEDYYADGSRGPGGPHVCTAAGCACDRFEKENK